MQDQVQDLQNMGVPCAKISSSQTEKENSKVISLLEAWAGWSQTIGSNTTALLASATTIGSIDAASHPPSASFQPSSRSSLEKNPTQVQAQAASAPCPMKLLYCAPEQLQASRLRSVLSRLHSKG